MSTDSPLPTTGPFTLEEPPDENALPNSNEYCTLRPDVAKVIDRDIGDQIRLFLDSGGSRSAAFTIYDIHDHDADLCIAEDGDGNTRLSPPAEVHASTVVPVSGFSRMDAFALNEITETVWDTGQNTLLVCAPHDGIESNTAQAGGIVRKRLGTERASAWFAHSFGPNAFDRFHITSANISSASWPGLADVERSYDHCISFHVFNGDDILVGGLADESFRDRLGERISKAINGKRHVETDHSEMKYAGNTQANIVNRLTTDSKSGIQIEMPPLIAQRYRKRVARAVAKFFDEHLPMDGEG